MTPLLELAERCERATGADRETDCLVWASVIFGGYEWVGNILRIPKTGMRIGSIDPGEKSRNFGCWHSPVPAYTASLDAAMMLVPEGWNWAAGTAREGAGGHAYLHACDDSDSFEADAATPAMALLAASLRALAAAPPTGEGE